MYTFSNDFEQTNQNLGISDDRDQLFFDKAKEVSVRAVFTDHAIQTKTQAIEIYLNEVQPQNMVEAFYAGMVYQNIFIQANNIGKKLEEQLKQG